MNTWHDLISEWGGPSRFGEDIGISRSAAQQMSSRNAVDSKYWARIVARAPQAGLQGITLELLVSFESGREAKEASPRFRRAMQAEARA